MWTGEENQFVQYVLAGIGGPLGEYALLEKAMQLVWVWFPFMGWLFSLLWPVKTVRAKSLKRELQLPLVIGIGLGSMWVFTSCVVSSLEVVVMAGQYAPIQIVDGICQAGKLSLVGIAVSAFALGVTTISRVLDARRELDAAD